MNIFKLKSKISNPVIYILLLLGFGISLSCIRNKYIIDDYRGIDGLDPNAPKYIVFFNPRLESNYTKSMDIPFPKDCIVKIYAFINNQESASVLSSLYYSETEGTLNADQDPMIMQAANYNFFAVSLKMDSIPPTFYNNEATGLLNGIDYLWAGTTDINVNTNKQVISLTFTHSATQLYFTIDNQSSDTIISKIESATINVVSPTSDASWGLMTGVISQISGDPDISGTVTIDSLSFNTICLPFIPSSNPEVTIHAYTNHNDYILMTLQAPTPDSGFVSGHSYQYEIAYAPENIVVKNVVVAPWRDIVYEPNINVPR